MATALTQFNAVGRRKNAVARVYLRPNGSGKITVNKRDYTEYFPTVWRQTAVTSPFSVTELEGQFDVVVNARGGGMTGLARGGVATGNTPYIVGAKGPELFIPSTTGRVVPNDQLGTGGVVVNQTINVTTGVQQTVRAEIANLLPQISNAAKSAVADARMRGGSFSRAMGTA